MKGILGRKVGMTQVFTTNGKLIPVTVVEVEPNVITQIKTIEKDGYNSIQLGAFDKKEKVSNRPEMGIAKKAKTMPKRFLKEIKGIDISNYEVGQILKADLFESGEIVDVTGTSKGKGFQGTIKRWNQSRGPMGHGSHYHRGPGSLGTMRPMRVLKGKHLPGHMGNEQITIQNLEVVSIDLENNCILISGNIPGPKGSYVLVKSAIKNKDKKEAEELITYVVEETIEESVETEEVVTEVTPETVEAETSETNEEVVEAVSETEEVETETTPEKEGEE